jgi:hypothetical protein
VGTYQNNKEFNADFKTVEKNANKFAHKKVIGKTSLENWSSPSSIDTTLRQSNTLI